MVVCWGCVEAQDAASFCVAFLERGCFGLVEKGCREEECEGDCDHFDESIG